MGTESGVLQKKARFLFFCFFCRFWPFLAAGWCFFMFFGVFFCFFMVVLGTNASCGTKEAWHLNIFGIPCFSDVF